MIFNKGNSLTLNFYLRFVISNLKCQLVKLKNAMATYQWLEKNNSLEKEFFFIDFISAMRFVNQVAIIAEDLNHHPDWWNSYNRVVIKLQTKDAGAVITGKDILLAKKIDAIYSKYS